MKPRLSPITRKRISRFVRIRTAFGALVVLLALYTLSLGAELIANSRPLVLKFGGNLYFPVARFYPEDTFLQNGRKTRPDYKKLAKHPVFAQNPDNWMVFAPVPFGPFETVDPASIELADQVTVSFEQERNVGWVNVLPDFTIVRDRAAAPFFEGKRPDGTVFTDRYPLPEELKDAVEKRFANQAAPGISREIRSASGEKVVVSLSTYRPRPAPPRTVRLTMEDPEAGGGPQTVAFDRDLSVIADPAGLWARLDERTRGLVLERVEARMRGYAAPLRFMHGGDTFVASFARQEVRFPFPPTKGHPMGIDGAGRDVFARVLYGMRTSFTFGILLVLVSMALGTMAGAVQGYYGARIDITGQRLIEIWSALPFLYVMIFLGSVYGRSFGLLLVVYAVFNWIGISYYMRGEFLRLRKQPFVEAARCLGLPDRKIIFRHILPNALVPVITFFPFSLVGAIGALAALDYLGFGLPPPTPSWGELLSQAQQYRWAWWLILYPSLALFTVMLLGVFVGEGIRNAFDPKQYSRLR
ncbi:MAG: ABC transporter permease subunit [Deltaproteobacteria bacterium]|nr:ABC transporter permease subunit [Deltaproteobacteria bacterium]